MGHRSRIPKPRTIRQIARDNLRATRERDRLRERARERMRQRFNARADRREARDEQRKRNPRGIRRIRPDVPVNRFFRGYPQIQMASRRRIGSSRRRVS